MSGRVAYVNGAYVPRAQAGISIEDRAVQFADSIYEVWGLRDGRFADEAGHFARLKRSLGELRIAAPMGEAALRHVLCEVARRNRVRDGLVYLQISRGAARRDHAFPDPAVAPTMIVTASRMDRRGLDARAEKGVAVITAPDIRWSRCDIKTTGLLPNALARQQAKESGAFEAWLVRDGVVTEACASNAWIVDSGGVIRTAPERENILRGVTRAAILKIAAERQMRVEERSFTIEEALAAREAFITSATAGALAVVRIDAHTIGDGAPGPVARALRAAYLEAAYREGAKAPSGR
ncbi:MAG: D-amino-acid transaminase [Alphaproteobacteria bacterium]|nr:D-amino-acid transaminase [Alphaproteobacteria bacterium]